MIDLQGVSHAFDGVAALRDITLRLDERRIGVIGANGSGKTTFGRLLNGLLLPQRGEVLVDGVSTRADGRRARRLVGMVFQSPDHQIVMPTVEEDLSFGPRNMGASPAEAARLVDRLLREYGWEGKRRQPAHLLSGGEKKLLTLLSVIIMEPKVIVFDEPLNSLDLRSRRKVMGVLDGLAQQTIVITHDLDLIAGYDRALLFEGGRVAGDGDPRSVAQRYAEGA
ncbi:MAG: ABC transporter ATP-binding protein [Hyphomicrobiales bacterium]|nr:ABC transporter ATP-binding protein [Hyphomicrobiales bacterium]